MPYGYSIQRPVSRLFHVFYPGGWIMTKARGKRLGYVWVLFRAHPAKFSACFFEIFPIYLYRLTLLKLIIIIIFVPLKQPIIFVFMT